MKADIAFTLSKEDDRNEASNPGATNGIKPPGATADGQGEEIDAANYNPDDDREEGRRRVELMESQLHQHHSQHQTNAGDAMDVDARAEGIGEPKVEVVDVGEEEEEVVEEEEDVDDMFAVDVPKRTRVVRVKKTQVRRFPLFSFPLPLFHLYCHLHLRPSLASSNSTLTHTHRTQPPQHQ